MPPGLRLGLPIKKHAYVPTNMPTNFIPVRPFCTIRGESAGKGKGSGAVNWPVVDTEENTNRAYC